MKAWYTPLIDILEYKFVTQSQTSTLMLNFLPVFTTNMLQPFDFFTMNATLNALLLTKSIKVFHFAQQS